MFDRFYLLLLSKYLLFKLLTILHKKWSGQGFLFLIASYKILTANSITFTTESHEINLPKFMRSTTKASSKLEKSVCTRMFLMVSSNKSQGE